MKARLFDYLQRLGRSFMLPIAILPIAGLLLGIGGSFTNETMINAYHLGSVLGEGTIMNAVLTVCKAAGDVIFANLPLIFAAGCAIGMANEEKDTAALSAVVAFFIMHATIAALVQINPMGVEFKDGAVATVVGLESLQMGVFGGIIVGLGVAALHNRFYKIQLPDVLSFFGGTRFVPIISGLVYVFVGGLMFFVWPYIQTGIYAVGDVVRGSGYFGTFVYGFMERLLIPMGLHHVFYLPFWQTGVGGELEVAGKVVEGAQNIFFAQLADPNTKEFAVSATRFMSGKFPLMIFGLPGAAYAMYRAADPERRKEVGGILLSAALTSMLTGITEPLEFTFLFVAPVLYFVHCIGAGLAYMFMHMMNVGVGMTFSGGLIDLTLFGIMQGNDKTHWINVLICGIGYFIVYYIVFYALIKKFDYKTPGRGDEEAKLYTKKDYQAKGQGNGDELSKDIFDALGGIDNVVTLDSCATRLRLTVEDNEKVDQAALKRTGASGVIMSGKGVQVIYGPRVSNIKSDLIQYKKSHETESEEL